MSRNHITLLSLDFPPVIGGISRYLFDIATCLPASQLQVVALAMQGGETFDGQQSFAIHRVSTPTKRLAYHTQVKYAAPSYLAHLMKQSKMDFLLCGQAHYSLLFPAWFFSKLRGIPMGVFTYGFDLTHPQKRSYRTIFNALLRQAHTIFTISQTTTDIALSIGIPLSKICMLPPFIGKRSYSSTLTAEKVRTRHGLLDKKCILTVGRLIERKGHDMVIKAMPAILKAQPQAHYLIVGRGPHESTLRALVTELGLTEHITFTGFVSDEELAAYYQAADLFTMISREIPEKGDIEGFGIVYLEANSFKLPVVAGRTGGVEDAVVHGKTGLLVDPYSCEQIASSITHLLQNQELAHQLGNYGWQRVETEFMGQSVSHHILQTLTSLQRS